MNNFVFYNPVKVLFGAGMIEKLTKEIPAKAKVMILYGGGSIKKNGVYDQVIAALEGHSFIEFSGIEPNPEYTTLMKAVDEIRKNNVDFLLAVGGGSVIDGVKFISAAVNFEGDDAWEILSKRKKFTNTIPFGTVLTLPATGSEMNPNSVISRKEIKEKLAFGHPSLYPKFSILDPHVVASLPKKQIRNGIIDAFVHVIEQYLTIPMNAEIQDRWAEAVLSALIETGPKVINEPDNYHHAANLMWEATNALNGIINMGVLEDWSTHMIGHELTAIHGLDHAETLAIVLPGVMNEMRLDRKSVV